MDSIPSSLRRRLRLYTSLGRGLGSGSFHLGLNSSTRGALGRMRSLSITSVVLATVIATLGSVGTAVADCEPGQPQTYCGPVDDPHNEAGDGPSLPAQMGSEVIELWAGAQQTPAEIDQGSGKTLAAESVVEVISPGKGYEVTEFRLEVEAEADRVTAVGLEKIVDVIGDGLEALGDALGLHTPIPTIEDADLVIVVVPPSTNDEPESSGGGDCAVTICLTR